MINVFYNFTTKSLAAHLDTNGHTRAHGAHPAYRKEGTNGHTAHIPHTATRRTLPVTSRGRPTRAHSAQHARPCARPAPAVTSSHLAGATGLSTIGGGTSGDGNSGVTCGVHRTPLRVTHVTNTPLAFHSALRARLTRPSTPLTSSTCSSSPTPQRELEPLPYRVCSTPADCLR